MKLQNLAVIFSIIAIPMTLILSAYIGIQIDTQSLQQIYDTKLLDATHDSVVAFQLNSLNNDYSTNADSLRRDVEASINTFFTSLATNLGAPGASTSYILQYTPAVVFTLYDGYYIYSPMETEYTTQTGIIKTKYEHTLKPYIHYSARYKDGMYDLVVNYSLDNYITVYGYMGGEYVSKAGYLISGNVTDSGRKYNGVSIIEAEAQKYYNEASLFTNWVKNANINGKRIVDVVIPKNAIKTDGSKYTEFQNDTKKILDITPSNDAESENSSFTAHKREIMRLSIQSNLNNAIYVYDQLTTLSNSFRMPILSEQDWDKILTNVNVITFLQGMPVGTKIYNNYAIVTSTKNKQYVNKEALYFAASDGYYHDINCPLLTNAASMTGYKNIDFDRKKDENGGYKYEHRELACYTCIVRPQNYKTNNLSVRSIKEAYYSAIGRERYNFNKLFVSY